MAAGLPVAVDAHLAVETRSAGGWEEVVVGKEMLGEKVLREEAWGKEVSGCVVGVCLNHGVMMSGLIGCG